MSMYRIATANSYDNTLLNIGKRQSDLATSQDQLSSGKRVLKASDDAVAATLAERAQNRLSRIQSDLRALEASRTALTQTESALGEANDVLHRARELLVQAGNPILTANIRNDLALQLEGLREQMLAVANRQGTSGLTLFGGLGGAEKPFIDTYGPNAGVRFEGQVGQYAATENSLPQAIDGFATWMRVPQGNGVFTTSLNLANQGDVAAGNLSVGNVTQLPDPVEPYRVEFFEDPATQAWSFQVVSDTSGAVVVPLQPYDPALGASVTVGTGTFDLTFDVSGQPFPGDTLLIEPVFDGGGAFIEFQSRPDPGNAGQLRSDLGRFDASQPLPDALNPDAVPAGLGYEIEFVSDTEFRIRDIAAGTLVAIDGATPVDPAAQTYVFEQDKHITFEGVTLQLQGVPAEGDRLHIAPVVGQPTDIFETMQNAIDALRYNGTAQSAQLTQEMARAIKEIDGGMDTILVSRGRVGEWLNRADNMETLFKDREVFHEKEQSDLTDLDFVKGISDFQSQQLALDAALKSYSQVQRLSLFQYIA